MRCTGGSCPKRHACPYFNSIDKLEFDPPAGICDLYDGEPMEHNTRKIPLDKYLELKEKLRRRHYLKQQLKLLDCKDLAKQYNVSMQVIYRIKWACRL